MVKSFGLAVCAGHRRWAAVTSGYFCPLIGSFPLPPSCEVTLDFQIPTSTHVSHPSLVPLEVSPCGSLSLKGSLAFCLPFHLEEHSPTRPEVRAAFIADTWWELACLGGVKAPLLSAWISKHLGPSLLTLPLSRVL